jgi:hypothetical protein
MSEAPSLPTKRSSVRRSSVRVPKVAVDINWSSTALQRRSAIRIVSEGGADCRVGRRPVERHHGENENDEEVNDFESCQSD